MNLDQQIAAVAREIAMRERVYPHQVRNGSMTQEAADHQLAAMKAVIETLKRLNTPEIEDFVRGVVLEAQHQVERWGDAHDRSKSAENWFWLVGYLAGKALRAAVTGDREKALHHTISTAAALLNWHRAITRDETGAGIGRDEDIAPPRLGAAP